ncbi:hypothetical protein ACFY36_51170 [Actinoplanes sp. NPDC000266]
MNTTVTVADAALAVAHHGEHHAFVLASRVLAGLPLPDSDPPVTPAEIARIYLAATRGWSNNHWAQHIAVAASRGGGTPVGTALHLVARTHYRARRFGPAAAIWSALATSRGPDPSWPGPPVRLWLAAARYALGDCHTALALAAKQSHLADGQISDRVALTDAQADGAARASVRVLCGRGRRDDRRFRADPQTIPDRPARLLVAAVQSDEPSVFNRRAHRKVCVLTRPPQAPCAAVERNLSHASRP